MNMSFHFLSRSYFSCCKSLEPSMWSSGWSHGCWEPLPCTGPLPCLLPFFCKPGALPSSLSNHCDQPRGAATQKKSLNQLSAEEGGRDGGRKRPGNLVGRVIGKEWQNPNRLRSCDWKKCFSWAGEKGTGHVFKDAHADLRLLGRSDCAQVKMHFFLSQIEVNAF